MKASDVSDCERSMIRLSRDFQGVDRQIEAVAPNKRAVIEHDEWALSVGPVAIPHLRLVKTEYPLVGRVQDDGDFLRRRGVLLA